MPSCLPVFLPACFAATSALHVQRCGAGDTPTTPLLLPPRGFNNCLPTCLDLQIHVQAVKFGGKFLETFFKSLPFWAAVYAEQGELFQAMVGGRWLLGFLLK